MKTYIIHVKGKSSLAHCSGCKTVGEAIQTVLDMWGVHADQIESIVPGH